MSGTIHEFPLYREDWQEKTTFATEPYDIDLADFLTREHLRPGDEHDDEYMYWGTIVQWPSGDGSIGRVILKSADERHVPYIYTINKSHDDDYTLSFKRKLSSGRLPVWEGDRVTEFVSYAAVRGDLNDDQKIVRAAISRYYRDRALGHRVLRALPGSRSLQRTARSILRK